MDHLFEELEKDYRFREGYHTCINCGTCTAVCPAAEFYRYDSRKIVAIVQTRDDAEQRLFDETEKGRQILPLTHTFARNILNYGYCVHPETFRWEDHMESGPVWKWHTEHLEQSLARQGANYKGEGPGVLRKIPQASLDELKAIFDVTGATERIRLVEEYSAAKAREMGMSMEEYERQAFEYSSDKHFNE